MSRARIGIDGYNLAMPNGTGVATYGMVLGETIRAAGHRLDGLFGLDVGRDVANRETMFYDALARPDPAPGRLARRAMEIVDVWRGARPATARAVPVTDRVQKQAFAERLPAFDRLWSAPRLFSAAQRLFGLTGRMLTLRVADPPAIMHWTYPLPIRVAGARNVYTIHDLVPLRLPYTTRDGKDRHHRLIARCIAAADHVCTVSEASLADIRDRFLIDPARITNTYQASPTPPARLATDAGEDANAIEGVFGLAWRGYFLFLGAIEPKKNLGRLIEAYLSIRTATPLVIVGARAWRAEEELKLLRQDDEASRGRVIRLDYLPRHLLDKLIRGARGVLFPSLFEGFGLPALEAMQLGAPLLASTAGSLPEVTGTAAVQVDPYDIGAIADGLRRLDTDAALRDSLSARGRIQAERFSRERYRERLSAMYDAILAAPARHGQ